MYCHWEHSSRLNVKCDVDLNGGRLNYPVSLIWSTVAVSQCRTGHDCAHNSTEKLIKEHCLPLEISLNRLWPWWLLSATDKIACGMINLLKKSNKLTWLTMNSYCWARTNRPYRLSTHIQQLLPLIVHTASTQNHRQRIANDKIIECGSSVGSHIKRPSPTRSVKKMGCSSLMLLAIKDKKWKSLKLLKTGQSSFKN